VLGRSLRLRGYHDVTRHPEGRDVPGLLLYRWDAPPFFASASPDPGTGPRSGIQLVTGRKAPYDRRETVFGTFERFIPLPEGFEKAQIEAAYEDGVLEVIVPAVAKTLEAPKQRTIPIKTALPVKAAKVS
jgi:Hsp20/alpha crystallin family